MTGKTQSVSDNVSVTDVLSPLSIAGGNVSLGVSDVITFTDTISASLSPPIQSQPQYSKAIIETYASNGSVSSRKVVGQILSAEVNKDGDRTVDSATFEFPMNVSIAQNNGVLYIQDVADTRFLRGIWNFHYNILDESGNALDGTSPNETTISLYDPNVLIAPNNAKLGINNYGNDGSGNLTYVGRKILTATDATHGDQITITNASNVIDLSEQFDIMFHFSCLTNADSNSNPKYIFDTQHGGGTGLSIFLDASGIINVQKNGGVALLTGVTSGLNDENWHFVRLVRDNTNLIRLFVDGGLESSTTSSESYQNSGADITIGTTTASYSTRVMKGVLLQLRIYCGGYLSDIDALNVFSYNPQPYTMKFGGLVWKIDDPTDSKTVYCKSFAQQLTNIQLSFNNLTTTTGSPPTSPYIANNVYVGKTGDLIIKDFATNVLSGWTVVIVPSFGTTITKYVASGALLTNLFYLLYTETSGGGGLNGGRLTFFSTARKVIIIEQINKDHTGTPGALNFVGVQAGGRYDITDDGKDDTAYINDVQVSGALMTSVFHETGSVASGRSATLAFAPISATVQAPGGTYLKMDNTSAPASPSFQIDVENKQIVFTGVANTTAYVIDYTYEDVTSSVWRNSDTTGITQNGRYSKQYNMVQMKDYFSMRNFAANIITRFGNSATHTIPRRITIDAPTLINSIRENYYVNVTNGVKGVADSASFINAKYAIKQIIYKYPEGKTTITLGDFLYDMFDPISSSSITTDQNTQSYSKTKNV